MLLAQVDTIIIGSGAAGIAISQLLQHSGVDLLCLEAHSLPGGSAGYFRRGKFTFDAGATTLSGLQNNGPLSRFLEICQLKPELKRIDPGIVFGVGHHRLARFADQKLWVEEQKRVFPQVHLEEMWQELDRDNQFAWSLVKDSAAFPPKSFSDLIRLTSHPISKLKLIPLLTQTLEQRLSKYKLTPAYKKFLDEILLISTQAPLNKATALMGIMGLSYPEDTWYPMGGMRGFLDSLTTNLDGKILYRHPVKAIQKTDSGFIVFTEKGEFRCKRLISTLPVWNTQRLLHFESRLPKINYSSEGYGALTGYYRIKLKSKPASLYHQVHKSGIAHASSGSLFLSLSPIEDTKRHDGESVTLSVSTHIRHRDYLHGIQVDRKTMRATWDKQFATIISHYFGEEMVELENLGIGDPGTFERYTLRAQGLVGGLPHTLRRNIFTFPHQSTGVKDFHQIGDTTFPGQGIVAVIQGALNLWERLV